MLGDRVVMLDRQTAGKLGSDVTVVRQTAGG